MPNLESVYDMTWAEFQIRLFAYRRMDLYDWEKLRELMWITYIAPNQDPKKMAKRKEQLLPLRKDKKQSIGVSQEHKEKFIQELKKWQTAAG
jgi:hypothetical protein